MPQPNTCLGSCDALRSSPARCHGDLVLIGLPHLPRSVQAWRRLHVQMEMTAPTRRRLTPQSRPFIGTNPSPSPCIRDEWVAKKAEGQMVEERLGMRGQSDSSGPVVCSSSPCWCPRGIPLRSLASLPSTIHPLAPFSFPVVINCAGLSHYVRATPSSPRLPFDLHVLCAVARTDLKAVSPRRPRCTCTPRAVSSLHQPTYASSPHVVGTPLTLVVLSRASRSSAVRRRNPVRTLARLARTFLVDTRLSKIPPAAAVPGPSAACPP
ncbi:hypothetical protein B0H13DRAFT_2537185 [Mycena leptocephala]|nr:hypothetical protein B0H13DRAFT_2537185 [Mycena leptocephala]